MKDILVLLTGGIYDMSRLRTAAAFAKHFEAHIVVVVAAEVPDAIMYAADPAIGLAPIEGEMQLDAKRVLSEARERAEQELRSEGLSARFIAINDTIGRIADNVARLSRLSDILIATIPAFSSRSELMKAVIDRALVAGGCGILTLAHGEAHAPSFKRVIVAWNDSREASRALVAALPLLKQTSKCTVLLVDQPTRRAGDDDENEVVVRLRHHGIGADVINVTSQGIGRADAIIAEAKRTNADLIVLGGQAEGGLRQWFQDSVSRKILTDAKIPLLIAH